MVGQSWQSNKILMADEAQCHIIKVRQRFLAMIGTKAQDKHCFCLVNPNDCLVGKAGASSL